MLTKCDQKIPSGLHITVNSSECAFLVIDWPVALPNECDTLKRKDSLQFGKMHDFNNTSLLYLNLQSQPQCIMHGDRTVSVFQSLTLRNVINFQPLKPTSTTSPKQVTAPHWRSSFVLITVNSTT